ncbi:FAD-dependent oxidoreductase [Streptomyces acidiscabies]|uniref:FAD-dependent oxidoreductase n=1 Tax=Streptomyces acidiscabies TaxID=42234 RepID=UPI00073F1FD2|nr:NAD(P)/FAD-dependent oxidoreductase [Streptomyces acidiscabies]GAQ58893.1 2,4-dichlorophenol 6-monooxygenase [Streptomyces acidiscabies]
MFDAIVVGARCAGAPTAMLLSRAGFRVLIVDKAAYGTDTLSTHLLHQPGVAALARWGLLDTLRETGCPPIERVRYEVDDIRLDGCARGVDGQRAAYSPRRNILDPLMIDAAVEGGAEYRERYEVNGLLHDDTGRVVGVRGRSGGKTFTETARLVIGADGMRSTVGSLVGAPFTVEHPRLTCAYYAYYPKVTDALELYEKPRSWVAAVPTHGDATLVLVYFPQDRYQEVRADAQAAYLKQVEDTAPELYGRIEGLEPLEKLRGTGRQQNFFRKANGPGWVLVGDAGHHKDSITARGISDGYQQVELLTGRLADALGDDPAVLDTALKDFSEDRDQALMGGYEATLGVARLDPHEQKLSLLRAVQQDEELTSIYFDTVAGIAPASALFTPKLLALL